jgi:hypothetical protein
VPARIADGAEEPGAPVADVVEFQKKRQEDLMCQRLRIAFRDMEPLHGHADHQRNILVIDDVEIDAQAQ